MAHTHRFVDSYDGFVGFGLERKTDENTVIYYLQKLSDDRMMEALVPRMSDDELNELFTMITVLLNSHLSEDEYHQLFLKDR